ncbi:MAG: small multi-drug export protein [Coriobacteriia bacterium]|nr:small multi-drug export protein [Coriobacteriia bacterium]
MEELVAGLPPYLKYVVLTLVPWVELRGAVPWAVQQGDRIYLPLIVLTNMLIFWPTYFGLELVYELIPEDTWLHRKLGSIRAKAHPFVEKYGVVGLAIFVSIPLPGTGAYSGTAASWLLDMGWRKAFLAVCLGVLIAFILVWSISEGIAAGVGVFRGLGTS